MLPPPALCLCCQGCSWSRAHRRWATSLRTQCGWTGQKEAFTTTTTTTGTKTAINDNNDNFYNEDKNNKENSKIKENGTMPCTVILLIMSFMAGVSSIAVAVLLPEFTLSISFLFAFVKHCCYTFDYIHKTYKSFFGDWLKIPGFLSFITSTFKAFVHITRRSGSQSLLMTLTNCIRRITCQSPWQSDKVFTIKPVFWFYC